MPDDFRFLTRRDFLGSLGAGGAAALALPLLWSAPAGAATARWHDPATWPSGQVPGPTDIATVLGAVVIDANASVAGVVIPAGASLTFDESASVTLESTGNVIVDGRLVMRPPSTVTHRLVFVGVIESRFVGGGLDPVATDVGLWVMGSGVLDVAGAPKRAWTRATGSLAAGTTAVTVADLPDGWAAGDEIVVVPTEPSTGNNRDPYSSNFDVRTLSAVAGPALTLSAGLAYDHPLVDTGRGVFGAEVLNLTRNARIEGTAGGRSHLFVRSTHPQALSDVVFRHLGPRTITNERVLGRWPVHIHHNFDGSRGSVLAGVVVRDAGSHAFVAHESHGVTFRDCVAYDVEEHPFWWDEGDATDDTLYDRCVAALVRLNPATNKYAVNGFYLAEGVRNTARNCVAVGTQGSSGAGFAMPGAFANGRWTLTDCVAHNNRNAGFLSYINTAKDDTKTVTRFTAYHNDVGIEHGSYLNSFVYDTCTVFANPRGGVELRAVANADGVRFTNLLADQAGRGDYGVVNAGHVTKPVKATRLESCTFKGHRIAGLGLTFPDKKTPDVIEVVDCTFVGNEFWLGNTISKGCTITFVQGGTTKVLRRKDQAGTFVPAWNASVT